MKKVLAGLIILLIVLSGCIELVKNGGETISINYSKSGSVRFEHSIKGEKGELFYSWEGDCTQKAKSLIDGNISFFQKQNLDAQNSSLSEQKKTDLTEENNRKINTLLSIKSTIKCELIDNNSMAELKYSFNLSQGFGNIKLFNNNYDFSLVKSDDLIESIIRVNSTANQKTGNLLEKIRIFSENGIKSIEPKDKTEIKDTIYEVNMLGMDGKEIILSIDRKEKTLPPGETKKDAITLFIEGFIPEKIISLEKEDPLQWIPTIFLALIIVIILAKVTKSVKTEIKEKAVTKKQAVEDKLLEKTGSVSTPKNKFLYMQEAMKPKQKIVKAKFNEEEKKQIKTIILALKESFQNYSKDEIKKSVMGKGYSDKVAQEVADFFYP
ncbi:MAG: hypothetical protein ABH986_06015 [archaeon]